MMNFGSVPSTTRTIRIKKESSLILEREAERNGITVNALISNLVDNYVNSLRFFQSGGMLSISSDTLCAMFEALPEEELADLAYSRGSTKIRDSILQRGMKVNRESILWYISQILGQYNGWFRCDMSGEKGVNVLHLSHNYGYKWSLFILNYVNSILNEVLEAKTNTVISEKAVNIEII